GAAFRATAITITAAIVGFAVAFDLTGGTPIGQKDILVNTMQTKKGCAPDGEQVGQMLSPRLQRRLDRHFVACSATVGASLAVVAGAHEAKAQIVYSGPENVVIPANSVSGIYFDF